MCSWCVDDRSDTRDDDDICQTVVDFLLLRDLVYQVLNFAYFGFNTSLICVTCLKYCVRVLRVWFLRKHGVFQRLRSHGEKANATANIFFWTLPQHDINSWLNFWRTHLLTALLSHLPLLFAYFYFIFPPLAFAFVFAGGKTLALYQALLTTVTKYESEHEQSAQYRNAAFRFCNQVRGFSMVTNFPKYFSGLVNWILAERKLFPQSGKNHNRI